LRETTYQLVLCFLALVMASGASAQLNQFSGCWTNVDPGTSGVTTLEMGVSGTDVTVHAWGKCHPTDCDWGVAYPSSYAYGPDVSSDLISEALAVSAVWTTSFSETLMTIRPAGGDRLQADVYTRFTDGSGRTAYTQSYVFERSLEYQCYQGLPNPVIELARTEDYTVSGTDFTRYMIPVTNWNVYPDELFEAAPDLPPCGLNTESSRTWIDIYNQDGDRIYGFCALGASEDLKEIWFAVKNGETPPESVYIVMTDRRCDLSYVSNEVKISAPTGMITPTTLTATRLNLPANLQALVKL
jgi:hypothetical protein